MTREEAIEYLQAIMPESYYEKVKEAVQMAIAALEREQQLLDVDWQNIPVDFYIGGRLFRVREIAQ